LRVLRGQKWPGNVRQLQNFIERLVVLNSKELLDEGDVRAELSRQVSFATQPATSSAPVRSMPPVPDPLAETHLAASTAAEGETAGAASEFGAAEVVPLDVALRAAEKVALERALKHAKQNRSLAARLLGLSRSTLYAKLKEHELL
jgi:two-component system response regulator AtoC